MEFAHLSLPPLTTAGEAIIFYACLDGNKREMFLLAAIARARAAIADGGGRAVSLSMAADLCQLGELYQHAGRAARARACFEASLSLRLRALGEDHVDTLCSKGKLAAILRQLGRLEAARFLDECVVDARIRLQGAAHPDTLASQAGLATTLALQRLADPMPDACHADADADADADAGADADVDADTGAG